MPDARFVLIGADRPHCPGGRTHAEYLEQEFPPEVRDGSHSPAGSRNRKWTLAQTADLFVAPSRYESFGLIFLEAMRWGTPVIGTTAGGIPEVVEDGKSGLLVPPEAPAELAAALIRLLSDPVRRATLGGGGAEAGRTGVRARSNGRAGGGLYAEVIRSSRQGRRSAGRALVSTESPLVSVVIPTFQLRPLCDRSGR